MLAVTVAGPGSTQLGRAAATPVPAAHFTLSTFNVLGSSHTPPGGARAVGATRIGWAVQLLDRHGVDVVGFQEMQGDQLSAFLAITGGHWAVYPGFALKQKDTDNSIGWRTDQWELVRSSTVDIPYFDGHLRAMPVVLLQNRASGILVWFANFHNPADAGRYPNQGRWRRQATTIEIAVANRLNQTGVPLFLTGDMNSRRRYFCRMTGEAAMKAARGGSHVKGVCDARRPHYVDWVFGVRRRAVGFSGYVEDRSPLVQRTTDHPVVVTDVTVDGSGFPRAFAPPARLTFP